MARKLTANSTLLQLFNTACRQTEEVRNGEQEVGEDEEEAGGEEGAKEKLAG